MSNEANVSSNPLGMTAPGKDTQRVGHRQHSAAAGTRGATDLRL